MCSTKSNNLALRHRQWHENKAGAGLCCWTKMPQTIFCSKLGLFIRFIVIRLNSSPPLSILPQNNGFCRRNQWVCRQVSPHFYIFIEKIYEQFDQDKNGVLTIDEAELAFKALGSNVRSDIDFNSHFNKLAKSDGTITFDGKWVTNIL